MRIVKLGGGRRAVLDESTGLPIEVGVRDPRGWGGYAEEPESYSDRLYLQRVRLDSGGYAHHGRSYFGIGAPLYQASNDSNTINFYLRARDRLHAIELVRERYPHARFYR